MYQKVEKYIEKYHMIKNGDAIIVGVSGGADSICLLLLLYRMQEKKDISLQVVHINHGIRIEATDDEKFVRQFCEKRKIPFKVVHVNVKEIAKEQHISTEEAGRNARYQSFNEAVLEIEKEQKRDVKIAVAHNKNDMAETVLFHLFRGSGMRGIAGIPAVRDNVIRPLLCVKREEIEAFLREQKILFCTDATNAENIYTRNKIRNEILPYINEEICENVIDHICETADIALETEAFLQKQVQTKIDLLTKYDENKILILENLFLQEEEIIQKYIIKECMIKLSHNRKDITMKNVKDVINLFTRPVGKTIMLPYGIHAKKTYTQIILSQEISKKNKMTIPFEKEIFIPETIVLENGSEVVLSFVTKDKVGEIQEKQYTKWFDYDRIGKSIKLRNRQSGDYLTINQNMDKKSLKTYMINEKIPKEVRGEKLLLADGKHILWIIGHRISQYYKVTQDTTRILQVIFREVK